MQGIEYMVLALTPAERWTAAQQGNPGSHTGYGLMLGAGAALVVLVVLLMWVSYRGWVRYQQQKREMFADDAARRGLSAHQCQILKVIAARSGIRQARDIFTREEAFDRGAAELLAECARTRTAQENEYLRAEIADLREDLGFQAAAPPDEEVEPNIPSDWSAPPDRVLMVFGLDETVSDAQGYTHGLTRTIATVGRVRRWQRAGRGAWVAVELTDLSAAEIDHLMHAVGQRSAQADDRGHEAVPPAPEQSPEADEPARRMAPAT